MASDALVTRGLTRRFGKRVAVDALDLTVSRGDVFGFLGPNGAGKTTAIRCILGLIQRDAGEVTIFGEQDRVGQRQSVGAMVETPAFHGWMTATEHLKRAQAFLGVRDAEAIDWALGLVGLRERRRERVRTYSLGMKQRLGIARAIVGRPGLLVLDEPTNGLDPRGMKEVRDLLFKLAKDEGITVFISSHLLGEIEHLCNRVAVIEGGRLIASGAVSELLGGQGESADVDVRVLQVDKLKAALPKMDGVEWVSEADGGWCRLRLRGMQMHQLNADLVAAGVSVTGLAEAQRSLEDWFMQMTSREIT